MQLAGFTDATAMLQGGVYALVHRGVVVYIGKSKVMLGRIYTHRSAWGRKSQKAVGLKPISGILFDSVWVQPCASDKIDALEYAMINLYKPRYNYQLRNDLPPPDLMSLVSDLVSKAILPRPQPEGTIRRRV